MARVHLHHMWILAALLSAMLLYSSLSPPYHFKPSHIPFSSMGVEKAGGSDSDSDGLKDLEEDANMNGLLDHFEISPTSPFNYDTDSDGIPDGEEYNYWVHRSETEPPGTLAEISAALGEIETMELLGPLGDIDFDGLPNVIDYDSDSDGLGDGEELKLALDPASPDSDGDTVPDAYERYPGVEDSDGDGIDDVWEEYWGTSREDRDGDGAGDLEEYLRGTSPLHPDGVATDILRPREVAGRVVPGEGNVFSISIDKPLYLRTWVFGEPEEMGWRVLRPSPVPPQGGIQIEMVFYSPSPGVIPYPYGGAEVVEASRPPWLYGNSEVPLQRVNTTLLLNVTIIYSPSAVSLEDIVDLNTTREGVLEEYLSKPDGLSGMVTRLATEVTLGVESDCQRALELANYLRQNMRYYPHSRLETFTAEGLYNFLFLQMRGDDFDFSSAYVVLLRSLGIPARVVEGYALGEPFDGGRLFNSLHHHYWAEFYLEGVGWVPIEVTPPYLGREGGSRDIPAPGSDPAVLLGGDGGGLFRGTGRMGELLPEGDEDLDGLNNSEEAAVGTSPYLADTDGDGLTDGEEVKVYLTDPTLRDTDSDGLTDGEEVSRYSTDPLRVDTDGGGVGDGIEVMRGLNPLDGTDDVRMSDPDGDLLPTPLEIQIGTDPLKADTDSDGLTDGEEWSIYRTDPLRKDTDLDGLTDGEEVRETYTSPTASDTDIDGLADGDEVSLGLSPRIWDTDGDGLSDGEEWSIYRTDPLRVDSDGDLLSDSLELLLGLDPTTPNTDRDGILDSIEVIFGEDAVDPFSPPHPAPADSDRDLLPDVYEVYRGTDPLHGDTDGDGLTDGEEFLTYMTDPLNGDTDGDGLTDLEEIRHRSSPLLPDTDSDGLIDGMEVEIGTSPREADTDLDGLSDRDELLSSLDPLLPDTDSGGVPDYLEYLMGTNPRQMYDDAYLPDIDGDGLPDVAEKIGGSNSTLVDTDGDGLNDGEEVLLYHTSPLSGDTDSDGLSDRDEIERWRTDPLREDTDLDGLSDGEEVESGLLPFQSDTDLDGLKDGEEVKGGTNPLRWDTDLDGLSDGEEEDLKSTYDGLAPDPLKNDTDGGGVGDLQEILMGSDPSSPDDDGNFSDLDGDLLPLWREREMGTDEGMWDTDSDGLSDGDELLLRTDPLINDTDLDGLTDGEEIRNGTSPLKNDTDLDGLSDGEEVKRGTDPLSPDTDLDGLSDGEEVERYGTDPLKADTDLDGLNDFTEVRLGSDPLRKDTDLGGALDGDEYHGGGDPLDPTDDWRWIDRDSDGLPDFEEATYGTDPEANDTDLDGLSDGEEVKRGTDPLSPDTDLDGLSDGEEVFIYGTDPLIGDTDGDGLSDGREVQLGLDPLSRDSDSDGLSDGEEVDRYLTNPLKKDSDSDGLTDGLEVLRYGTDPWVKDTDRGGMEDGEETKEHLDPLDPSDDRIYMDDDSDGLLNWEELTLTYLRSDGDLDGDGVEDYRTFPNVADSDSDGLTDGEEVFFYGTEPLVRDTDGDGLTDGEEVKVYLTSPVKYDTDGDGMGDGAEIDFDIRSISGDYKGYVDWDGDGRPNFNTNPLSVDTDGGGEWDREEILHYRNPLDPSDDESTVPGGGVLEIKVTRYPRRIEVLSPTLGESVEGVVTDDRGEGVPSLLIKAFLIPEKIVGEEGLEGLLSSPESVPYSAGSGRASQDGSFRIGLVAPAQGEAGENYLVLYISGRGGSAGRVHVVSTVEVVSSTYISLNAPESLLLGDKFLVKGSLTDYWHQPIEGRSVRILWGGEEIVIPTSEGGLFFRTLTATAEGTFKLTATFRGEGLYLPSSYTATIIVYSGELRATLSFEGESFFAGDTLQVEVGISGYTPQMGRLEGSLFLIGTDGQDYPLTTEEVTPPSDTLEVVLNAPPGVYTLSLTLKSPSLPSPLHVIGGELTLLGRALISIESLQLPRGVPVKIDSVVVASSGEPLGGVRVTLKLPEALGGEGFVGTSSPNGSVVIYLTIPPTAPLGFYNATVYLKPPLPYYPPLNYLFPLIVASRVQFVNITYPSWTSRDSPIKVSGRLLDDAGQPLEGEDCILLHIGGDVLARSSLYEGGRFTLTATPPPHLPPGNMTFVLLFTGFEDERAAFYLRESIPLQIEVLHQTYLTFNYSIEKSYVRGEIRLLDEEGEGIEGATLEVVAGGQRMMVHTGGDGSAVISYALPSIRTHYVTVTYRGNFSRHLSPAQESWRITVEGGSDLGRNIPLLFYALSAAIVALIVVQVLLYFRRLRPLKEARRAFEREELYRFVARGRRRAVYALYREFLRRMRQRGFDRRREETLREYFSRLERLGVVDGERLKRALPHLERAFYSTTPLSSKAVKEVGRLMEGGEGS